MPLIAGGGGDDCSAGGWQWINQTGFFSFFSNQERSAELNGEAGGGVNNANR